MAIIDKHKGVKIDKAFSDRHVEMFAFFDKHGIDVEVNDNFKDFQHFLTHLTADNYPYRYDEFFNASNLVGNDTAYALYLKKDDKIIATYAAKELEFSSFFGDIREFAGGRFDKVTEDLNENSFSKLGTCMYSSCQWVDTEYRGKRFGMILDHLKKNICFDIFEADMNYAIHKEQFADYHIKGLHYDESKWLATVEKGDVGGAGEKKDKVYHLTWVTKESWANKLIDVRMLYI